MSQALANPTPSRRVLGAVGGGVFATVLMIVGWFAYYSYAIVNDGVCFLFEEPKPNSPTGWGDNGFGLAAMVGLGLWAGFGVVALRKPGRVGTSLGWFTVSYAVCLLLIGLVAPLLWDPPHCRPTPGGF